jgi:FKBP-type peptidyl-prolyl cis-trans isomerase 2
MNVYTLEYELFDSDGSLSDSSASSGPLTLRSDDGAISPDLLYSLTRAKVGTTGEISMIQDLGGPDQELIEIERKDLSELEPLEEGMIFTASEQQDDGALEYIILGLEEKKVLAQAKNHMEFLLKFKVVNIQ